MVTHFKYVLALAFGAAGLALAAVATWVYLESRALPDVRPLTDPERSFQIEVRGWDGQTVPFPVGPGNPHWTALDRIPDHLRKAVLAGEDFSFYGHRGVDWYEVYQSFRKNFRERRFARGASTISQQLAKNLFLSREKTISRKVRELVLTRRLENTLTKDRILELYLNVVEMGNMVYGVGQGSRHHFGKGVSDLTIRESAFLAAMLPGPKVYDPLRNLDRVMNRSDHILGVMLKGKWITEEEYLEALVEIPYPYGGSGSVASGGKEQELPPEGIQEEKSTLTPEQPHSAETANDEALWPSGSRAGEEETYTGREGIVEIPVGE